jgi:type VI secretion system protein ImpA
MAVIAIEQLLQAVAPDTPCGPDLEYEPAFRAMEAAAKPKPAPEFERDKLPEPPDWRVVQAQALEVLARSKDLRAAVYLTRALLNNQGLSGFSDGLALVNGLLERYWETLHPQLDPDDHDATMRVNVLLTLCDRENLLKDVRESPLVSSRVLGRFNLRDIDIATGAQKPSATAKAVDMGIIDAAFLDCDLAELQATASAARQSIQYTVAIEAYVTDKVGAANAPSLGGLVGLLQEMQSMLAERLARRGANEPAPAPVQATEASDAVAQPPSPIPAPIGQITSREDVIRLLDKLCEYYARNEPSSPVPLLLQRARRLASKTFLEILRDIAPSGIAQAELIGGIGTEPPSDKPPPAKK